jgi:hypothetical protein
MTQKAQVLKLYIPFLLYLILSTSNCNAQSCTFCPPEAKSCDEDHVYLKLGYWRANEETSYIHSCVEYSACGGGNATGLASCLTGIFLTSFSLAPSKS